MNDKTAQLKNIWTKTALLFSFATLIMLLSGCDATRNSARIAKGHKFPTAAYSEFAGDPAAVATLKAILILPFENAAGEESGYDDVEFATRLANQFNLTGKMRIIYPREALAWVERENAKIERHNAEVRRREMLGIKGYVDREARVALADANLGEHVAGDEDVRKPLMDPIHNIDDAIKVGRYLKADAVLMGTVTDHDPYTRPRMAIDARLIATGRADNAANALSQLMESGIPTSSTYARGMMWRFQRSFDTRESDVGRDLYLFGYIRYTEEQAYNEDVYMRSMRQFYDYVSAQLAVNYGRAKGEAVVLAEQKALVEARRRQEEETAIRKRICALTDSNVTLPEEDAVIAVNLYDRKNRQWRPDVYYSTHPEEKKNAYQPNYVPPAPQDAVGSKERIATMAAPENTGSQPVGPGNTNMQQFF